MKSRQIKLIFVLKIIFLLGLIRADHVAIIRCAENPECLKNLNWNLINVIKENLGNYSESACENFWDYACGSWTAAPYYDHADNFGVMTNYYADNLIETLNQLQQQNYSLDKNQNISELVKQVMIYFESCLNSESYYLNMSIYFNEIPLEDMGIKKEFKWHYMFEDNAELWQDFNWLEMFAILRRYGFKDVFVKQTVGFARHNSTQYVLNFKIPSLGIHFENKYRVLEVMEEFDLLFVSKNKQNYRQLAQTLHEFDGDLTNLYKKYAETYKQTYLVTLQDLKILSPELDWSLYFKILLNQPLALGTPVESSIDLQYFQDLLTLIEQKPKRIIFSYLLLRFGKYLMDIRPLVTPRECLLNTNVMFPLGINYIYNRFLYKNRLQDELVLQNMFSDLKQEFSSVLNQNKFSLTQYEIKYLQNKLQKMQLFIGNLPFQIPNLNRYYRAVELNENNFHYNHLEMLKFRTTRQHQALLKPFDSVTFYINDDIITLRNAPYFVFQRNVLVMPMVFLQLPFYHHQQHPLFQYSLVGWIMAHEMSHAFDGHGLQFDAEGNENLIGLQLARKPLFLSTLQCLTKRLSTISLNERLADVNGLQLAWQAFRKHQTLVSNETDYQFYSQLFFINFAQLFCGSLPHAIDHDRDDVRVRQTIANMQEFSQVFHCTKETKENPVEKCNIWRKQL